MRLERTVPPAVLAAIRAPFAGAGGTAIETPVAEPLGPWLDLAGEALRERLFLVQGPNGEDYCLRPEFTVGVTRAHLGAGAGDAARLVYEGPAFRVAPDGSSRAEQFLQVGLEAIGEPASPKADAAILDLAWRAAAAGGRDDLTLMLGDAGLIESFLVALGVAPAAAARLKAASPSRLHCALEDRPSAGGGGLADVLSDLPEERAARVLEEIWALTGVEPVGGRGARDIVHRLRTRAGPSLGVGLDAKRRQAVAAFLEIEDTPQAAFAALRALASGKTWELALDAWEQRLAALTAVPADRIRFAAALHRPFSYYDGLQFEIRSAALGEVATVAAGGRYDHLPQRLGAAGVATAVGCMVRPGRAWSGGGP